MHVLARFLFVPVVRIWAALAAQGHASVPRPTDAPQAHSAGINSDQVLLFGSGPAAGWGVRSHDLALPGSLARALSALTHRGADVNVVARPMSSVAVALDQLRRLKLRRFDAVVVILGVNDAVNLTSLRSWRSRLSLVLNHLERETAAHAHVYILGIQPIGTIPMFDGLFRPMADRHAQAMNRVTQSLCQNLPHTTFVPLTNASFLVAGRYRTSTDYREWGQFLASEMAPHLDQARLELAATGTSPVVIEPAETEQAHTDRQRAVESLGILGTRPESRFDRIVALTRRAFGTESAMFLVVDRDRVWIKSSVGPVPTGTSWGDSMSLLTVQSRGAIVLPDTLADPRLVANPYVLGAPFVRFFAGFHVESPSGEPIGMLCIFDPVPRPGDEVDRALLREFALMIQGELRQPMMGDASIGSVVAAA